MEKSVSFNGSRISYRTEGSGKPVMLVHGFGETGKVWDHQVEYLKSRYLVIIPDLPGSGSSALLKDVSMESMAEVLEKIAIAEDLERFTMIGHSMGGYVLLAFAEKHPDKLNGFGLFHSSSFPDTDEKKATRRKGIAFIKEHGAFEFLKTATPNLFSPASKESKKELITSFVEGLSGFSAESLVAYYEAMIARPDRSLVLQSAIVPVLFVIGEHDAAVPVPDSLKQSHYPDKSAIHILQESGHMGMLEETTKTNEILLSFLDSLSWDGPVTQ